MVVMISILMTLNFTFAQKQKPDEFLWEQGRSAYLNGDWSPALIHLKKLVQLHPSSSYTIEAYSLIAHCFQKLDKKKMP